MSDEKPIYDLVLLLDPAAADGVREKVLEDTERTIQAQGDLIGRHDWGQRTMAYEIRHQTLADYHLLQFHATSALLESLQRTLRITDGIIRFRIIKLAPGTPPPPDVRPEPVAVSAAAAAPAAAHASEQAPAPSVAEPAADEAEAVAEPEPEPAAEAGSAADAGSAAEAEPAAEPAAVPEAETAALEAETAAPEAETAAAPAHDPA